MDRSLRAPYASAPRRHPDPPAEHWRPWRRNPRSAVLRPKRESRSTARSALLPALAIAPALLLSPLPARGAPPDVPAAPAVLGGNRPAGATPLEWWRPFGRHGFAAAGISLLSSSASTASGWALAGGAELPLTGPLTLVPRASLAGADGGDGTFLLARPALDARLNVRSGRLLQYVEAGAGVSLADAPESGHDSPPDRVRQHSGAAAAWQFAVGARGDPEHGRTFQFEVLASFEGRHEGLNTLEMTFGVTF